MQTANPSPAALGNTRADNDVNVPVKRPAGNPRAGAGTLEPYQPRPMHDEWEWRMQSREGLIRYRRGPDDPRVA